TEARIEEAARKYDVQRRFDEAHSAWEKKVKEIRDRSQIARSNNEKAKAALELERRVFAEKQKLFNSEIDQFKKSYFEREPDALIRYWNEVVSNSDSPA